MKKTFFKYSWNLTTLLRYIRLPVQPFRVSSVGYVDNRPASLPVQNFVSRYETSALKWAHFSPGTVVFASLALLWVGRSLYFPPTEISLFVNQQFWKNQRVWARSCWRRNVMRLGFGFNVRLFLRLFFLFLKRSYKKLQKIMWKNLSKMKHRAIFKKV